IQDYSFSPPSVTVAPGATVCWTNNGDFPHTATSSPAGGFDTGTLGYGQSARVQFPTAGTYDYLCTIHPFMTGRGVGSHGPPTPPPPPPPAAPSPTPASTRAAAASTFPAARPRGGADGVPVQRAGRTEGGVSVARRTNEVEPRRERTALAAPAAGGRRPAPPAPGGPAQTSSGPACRAGSPMDATSAPCASGRSAEQ